MEGLKTILFSILVFAGLGAVGYWAVLTMQSGGEYASNAKLRALQEENEELKEEITELKSEIISLTPEPKEEVALPETASTTPPPATFKHQELIKELQKLADENIVMKLKSKGTRVGTVQEFLNLYNKTSNKIDNDYGETTKRLVVTFQKAQGLSGDGEAGKTTFQKMIEWLKTQG